MKGRGWIGLFLFILLAGTVYSAEVNEEVIEALNDEEEVPVIVFLKDRVDNPPKNLDQEITRQCHFDCAPYPIKEGTPSHTDCLKECKIFLKSLR